jgi:hypothetical protein
LCIIIFYHFSKIGHIFAVINLIIDSSLKQDTPRGYMTEKKDQKRLVLIGIRRKGEKGFKKRIDNKFNIEADQVSSDILPVKPEQTITGHVTDFPSDPTE